MIMKKMHRFRRMILVLLAVPLALFLIHVPLEAQEKAEVRNVNLEIREDIAIITYDLIASFNESYDVTAALVKEGDASFRIPVVSATGDIGRGKYAGLKREIRWEWRKDLPKDFTGGTEYSIEITPKLVSSGGGSWLYYVLGGALVAGGIIAFAGKKSGDEATGSSPLPSSPPGRPF